MTSALKLTPPWHARLFPNHEWALLLVLILECPIFSVTGTNFFTGSNALEITRLSVEVGLLALALTPIIITGGIDLSVGSMMGLAAVVLGALWRDAHLPLPLAAAIAPGDWRCRWQSECAADIAARAAAADRYAGNFFALSRRG